MATNATRHSELDEHLASLHEDFGSHKLEVLIGAGVSIPSGLPDWSALNRGLLKEYFRHDQPTGVPDEEELAVLAEVLESRFGSSAAIDHVREGLRRTPEADQPMRFPELLRRVLYGASRAVEIAPIQYELAAWLRGGLRGIHTFNYDDLIQRAFEQLTGEALVVVERPTVPPASGPWICHVHGRLPAHGTMPAEDALILSEKDYLKDVGSWADRRLASAFESGSSVLLVGLSLVDPRLRRQLFERVARKVDERGRVYALMSRTPPSSTLDLAHRKAEAVVDARTADYWREWDVTWLDARGHVRVPHLLRRIRLGDDLSDWFEVSRTVISVQRPKDEDREVVARGLMRTVDWLRHRFCVREEERLRLNLWVPSPNEANAVRLTFDSGWRRGAGVDPIGASTDEDWDLEILDVDRAQGVAGHSFLEGVEIEADSGSPRMDQHFTPEMRSRWKQVRDFAALLCVPVAAGEAWVPVGVACLCSNSRVPFWSELDRTERVDLNVILRSTFDEATATGRLS